VTPEESEAAARTGRGLLLRAALGGLLIVVLTAGATATAGLLQVHELVQRLGRKGGPHIANTGITEAEAGKPQTILVLGSDRRFDEFKANNPALKRNVPARSDTVMLIRLDPHQPAISILSLPRDLKVEIPGHGIDKLNDAYSLGGPTLTLQTIKQLTGLKVNHVVNVQFHGFKEAVDELHCIYVDVDRRYYHSNVGLGFGQRYAEINIQPGYQRLCGSDALSYVRYRHTDSDIVRAARQQDFLRAVKDQVSTSQLFNDRNKLIDIFASSTQTDASLDTTRGLLRIVKLALFSAGHPVREVQFPAQFENDTLPGGAQIDYVIASPESVQRTVNRFLHPTNGAPQPKVELTPDEHPAKKRHLRHALIHGLADGRHLGSQTVAGKDAGMRIYFPSLITTTSRYAQPALRAYTVRDRAGNPHRAYRLVLSSNTIEGQYWGVQGMTWRTPPVLEAKHEQVKRRGRRLSVYRDGGRIRLVAWHAGHSVYWVSNTLSMSLDNSQMLEIAATLARRPRAHP
jgi:polyisoprenyl-teichoic acid--peptidoglycan teichoic acid transferase